MYEGLVSCQYETTMPEDNLMTFKSNHTADIKKFSHSTSFLKHEYLGYPFSYESHISRKIMFKKFYSKPRNITCYMSIECSLSH